MPAPALEQLPAAPASSVKREGWRGIMQTLPPGGRLLVTNHNRPEAVILSIAQYTKLAEAEAGQAALDPLAGLRRQFDERLAALNEPGAGGKLRELARQAVRLDGEVKAGSTY
jgi:PHD/YefM family antitoxin component YafN of YafNO toxin-antitoxin module